MGFPEAEKEFQASGLQSWSSAIRGLLKFADQGSSIEVLKLLDFGKRVKGLGCLFEVWTLGGFPTASRI